MAITVKFFASLSEQLGMREVLVESKDRLTVEEIWEQVTGNREIPAKILIAINMEYARYDDHVSDNDEVAFFPPVTGG